MPVTLGLAGAGVLIGGVQSIMGASQASKAKKNLINEINNQSLYQPSEYAQRSLAEAQARENAKAAAVTYGEKMLGSGLANAQANVARNASSGQQALAMGASNIAQYNQGVMDLGQVQNQYNQQAIGNTNAARGVMIGEQEKAFNSVLAKQNALQGLYAGQLGAGNAMLSQGLGTMASGLIGAAGAYGGGNSNNTSSTPPTVKNPDTYYNSPTFNPAATPPRYSGFNTNAYKLQNNSPLVFAPSSFGASGPFGF
jgi:hypothetical protein